MGLFQNIRLDGKTGCWEWTGRTDEWGYGVMWFDGRNHKVHRVSAHLYRGFDLSSGLLVCHHCDNPPCFKPDHLFYGTDLDNARDCAAKGREWNSKKTHCLKGHPLFGANVQVIKGRRYCQECNRVRVREFNRKMSDDPEWRARHNKQARESYWRTKGGMAV